MFTALVSVVDPPQLKIYCEGRHPLVSVNGVLGEPRLVEVRSASYEAILDALKDSLLMTASEADMAVREVT